MKFKIAQQVLVTPKPNDIFSHEFAGFVEDFYENGTYLVSDQDSDLFVVDADQLEAIETE